ncbi:MAG: hypothetical protein HQL52_17615 [Magnetococcales bacterium]|nr:hypothetical protein [Magnetococcales bacterium]
MATASPTFPPTHHRVKYESLVTDFPGEVAKLLDFLGLDWDERVLKYHQHAPKREIITTHSYQSVAEPIYQRAKYRWKRYETQLEPFLPKLTPFIEAFGYEVDA